MANDGQVTGKFWTDPWNIAYGCTPAGAGCKNCWAEANHHRWYTAQRSYEKKGASPSPYSEPFAKVNVLPERFNVPLHWKKPRIIAVNFSGDPYHKAIPDEMLDRLFAVMALCPQHTFILLTKRWERMAEYWGSSGLNATRCEDIQGEAYTMSCGFQKPWTWDTLIDAIEVPLPNVWQGVSVSTQAELVAARSHLLATLAAVWVLSLEPLLEQVYVQDFVPLDPSDVCGSRECGGCPDGDSVACDDFAIADKDSQVQRWIIVGCETGPKHRPCRLEWIKSIVAQCKAADIPVWVKAVEINGRVSHKMSDWPASIRVRELPGKVG